MAGFDANLTNDYMRSGLPAVEDIHEPNWGKWRHYRAPTEGGSSGSPVFNQDWELLGLHHSGGKDMAKLNGKEGRYAANEGIWIEALRKGID